MTVLVYLNEAIEANKRDSRYIQYPVAEINITELLDAVKEKFGIQKAKSLNINDLRTYAASRVMKKPEEIILRSKPICKGA